MGAVLLMERGLARVDVALPPTNTTPLRAACRAGMSDMVQLLLRRRADPDAHEVTPCGGRTPLHLATQGHYLGIVADLLRGGASPLISDSRGQSSLHLAAQEG